MSAQLEDQFHSAVTFFSAGDHIECRSIMELIATKSGMSSRIGVDAMRWIARSYYCTGDFGKAADTLIAIRDAVSEFGFDLGSYWHELFDALCCDGRSELAAEIAKEVSCAISGADALDHIDWIHFCCNNCKNMDVTPFIDRTMRLSALQLGCCDYAAIPTQWSGVVSFVCNIMNERDAANERLRLIFESQEACENDGDRRALLENVIQTESAPLVVNYAYDALAYLRSKR